eukprot:6267168-Pyramimonas_sp.AAC.1
MPWGPSAWGVCAGSSAQRAAQTGARALRQPGAPPRETRARAPHPPSRCDSRAGPIGFVSRRVSG